MSLHTLDDVREEFRRLDKLCGVSTEHIKLRVSTRATRQYGCAKWRMQTGSDGVRRCVHHLVQISDFIMETDEQFWNTVRHEYAHVLVTMRDGKNHGHDAVWKAACKEVGCAPNRCSLNQEAHELSMAKRAERARYRAVCTVCGQTYTYVKAGRIVKALQAGRPCWHAGSREHSLRLETVR